MRKWLCFLVLIMYAALVFGKEAVPMAEDPVIEARLIDLSEELRCLVCQNQALSESDSEFANDLRQEMRGMMRAGKTDAEIIDFLVQRFGDFILFRPPMQNTTLLLWFGPLLLLILGAVVLIITLRRRSQTLAESPIAEDEHRRAERLLSTPEERESNS